MKRLFKITWLSLMAPVTLIEITFLALIDYADKKTDIIFSLKKIKENALKPIERYVIFIKDEKNNILWGLSSFIIIFILYEIIHIEIIRLTWDNWFVKNYQLIIILNKTMLAGIILTIFAKLSILALIRKIWRSLKRRLFKIKMNEDKTFIFKSYHITFDKRVLGIILFWIILFPYKWAIHKPKQLILKEYKAIKDETLENLVKISFLKNSGIFLIFIILVIVLLFVLIEIKYNLG